MSIRFAASRPRPASGESGPVGMVVLGVVSLASVLLFATSDTAWLAVREHPEKFATFFVLALVLQSLAVNVYGRGSIAVSGIGMLATGFALGPGPAVYAGLGAAAVHAVKKRPKPYRVAYNAAVFALSASGAAFVYEQLAGAHTSDLRQFAIAVVGGVVFTAINIALLTTAMSVAESISLYEVWKERFRWLIPHYVAFGPLAIAVVLAYGKIGIAGVAAFAVPPALMIFSLHQYLDRTRESVDEVRAANAALSERNDDLQRLLEFSVGLAARAHDRDELIRNAERSLAAFCGGRYKIRLGEGAPGLPLLAGGDPIGGIDVDPEAGPDFDGERWTRLQETFVSNLATALESAQLVREVRERHKATIAALSRSMEVKDGYTSGHTERVSDVAAALGRRLGYKGEELDAIEIGALLHDIGKIGIPERILHKPGPLDDDEWQVMKTHPLLSEHILTGVGLSPLVLQIARSSHERMDGKGYPDGLVGDAVPLPARIVLVADAFDALTSDRPYRRATTADRAIAEIRSHTGTQFCPRVVAALERVYQEEPAILGAPHLRAVGAA